MRLKSRSLIALFLGLFLAWAPALAWALSADELLDLMVDEKAITPDKAEKIKQKARKIDQVKKAEEDAQRARELQQVKQEAKTEAKAEAKAEAAKEAQAVVKKQAEDYGLSQISKAFKGLSIGILAYVDYSLGDRATFKGPLQPTGSGAFGRHVDGHVGSDQWTLTRGYLNVIKEITPWLLVRYTPDLNFDATNGWILRQKYLYAEVRPPNAGTVLTQMKGEIGLGHTPWHDFEETIYPYRCQGTIPIERAGVFSSADIGLNLRGNIGGQLADAKEKTGNAGYDGRYGSWHVGVYNGSGYTAAEVNQNKVPEYRITLRPLPDYLPGFQATYFGLYGMANSSSFTQFNGTLVGGVNPLYKQYYPAWIVHQGYLSYQHPWFILTAQIFTTKGNQSGTWTNVPNNPSSWMGAKADSLWTLGYSIFGDVKVPLLLPSADDKYPLHAFYRTDWFNADQNHVVAQDAKYTKLITGLAYHVYKNNMILMAYERTWYGQDYGANFTRPGSIGAGGGLSWPSSVTARTANVTSNGGNLGTDQRFQVVFQVSY